MKRSKGRTTLLKRKNLWGPAAAAMVVGSALYTPPAHAAYIVTLEQVGTSVVATGSGSFNLMDFSFAGTNTYYSWIDAGQGQIIVGPATLGPSYADYFGVATGPTNFGSGGYSAASSGSGDLAGFLEYTGPGRSDIFVPNGYVSGVALSGTATWGNATFDTLGVTPGTYTWTWGTGADADSFTLQIDAAPVPEPNTLALLGMATLFGLLLAADRRRRCASTMKRSKGRTTLLKRKNLWGPAAAAMVVGSALYTPPAHAAYTVTLEQVGSDVVATGSGTLDTTDLGFFVTGVSAVQAIDPSVGFIAIGSGPIDEYIGVIGPASFGTGGLTFGINTGDPVALSGSYLSVPHSYSGGVLSDTATYTNQTFDTLGVTPGTYEWTWGSGTDADSFTLQVGAAPAAVPEPNTLTLLGTAALFGLLLAIPRRHPLLVAIAGGAADQRQSAPA